MSAERLNLTSSPMDKETATIDEITNTLVSDVLEHTAANLSEQMLSFSSNDTEEWDSTQDDSDDSSDGSPSQQKAEKPHDDTTVEDNKASDPDLNPTQEKVEEEKPPTEEEMRNLPVRSLSSTDSYDRKSLQTQDLSCLFPSPHKLDEDAQPQNQPLPASPEVKSEKTCSPTLITMTNEVLPCKDEEENDKTEAGRLPTMSRLDPDPLEKDEFAADQQLVLKSSEIAAITMRFFQSLSDEQWREVSEGVYNKDVKEQLLDMCTDVIQYITDFVIRAVLQSIHRDSITTDAFTMRSPQFPELMEDFYCNIKDTFESSFGQALQDILGEDNPVKVAPEFSQAITGDVINEVNSALSVASQCSIDVDSPCTVVPVSSKNLKDKTTNKTLGGAVSTLQSLLTGRVTAIKRQMQTIKRSDSDVKEETETKVCQTKRKMSLRKRCSSAWHKNRVQPGLKAGMNAAVSSTCAELTPTLTGEQQQPTESCSTICSGSPQDENITGRKEHRSTPLELDDYVEDEDNADKDSNNVASPLSITEAVPSDQQVFEATKGTDDFQDSNESDDSIANLSSASEHINTTETEAKKQKCFCSCLHNLLRKDEEQNRKEEKKEKKKTGLPLGLRLLCFFCIENSASDPLPN
ncbi:uncharacterized protein LOC117812240 [Notolabrus celidotus]|uniref:uncharacterized protein LOC117812240 n=1 Tax=Notolabrus celidotus TaxID=1203425 RepID=UPI00148FE370|nr:uncharacterized protein LOC117812240 [Notolabrus celidotus]